jgi:hypothetical protein
MSTSSIEEDIFINDVWNLYFHDPYDVNWNNESYMRLSTIASVDDFWKNHLLLKMNVFHWIQDWHARILVGKHLCRQLKQCPKQQIGIQSLQMEKMQKY